MAPGNYGYIGKGACVMQSIWSLETSFFRWSKTFSAAVWTLPFFFKG